jgi:N-acetyl-anhydromuramyl-L-alanine amidase AmpD
MKYLWKPLLVLLIIVMLLLVAWKNIPTGRAENMITPTPASGETEVREGVAFSEPHIVDYYSASPVISPTPTTAPTPTFVWSPNLGDAQHYQTQCIAANGVGEAKLHEVVVGKVVFLPDYETAEIAPSCNFVEYGENKPSAIVLHFTGGSLAASLSWFRKAGGLSAHYLIDRDGTVYQLIPEVVGAKHVACAGDSCLPSCPDWLCGDGYPELTSIGIELVNDGYVDPNEANILLYEDYQNAFGRRYWEDYPDIQLQVLKDLVCDIASRWNIPVDPDHVLGHYRINQKVDPGPALNLFWERLGTPYREPLFTGGCGE